MVEKDLLIHELTSVLLVSYPDATKNLKKKSMNVKDMTRGWSIGNFSPSFLKTTQFEVGILTHKAGEKWPFHIHDRIEEYNYLISGKMVINGIEFVSGDSFMFPKGHPAVPIFIEDCNVICVKIPSIPSDKRII